MALKLDKEIVNDTKKEHNANFGKNKTTDPKAEKKDEPVNAPGREENSDPVNINNASEENKKTGFEAEPENSQTDSSGFKEKFDEYFKGMDGLIGGEIIAGIVDDLKANFLFIHAQKNGVNLPKEAFVMDAKTKKFAAFLIDHALKNKLFGVFEKYPIAAAAGVIGVSGISSYLMIQMMSKGKKENEDLKKQNEKMKMDLERFKNAQTVEDLNENKN